MFGRLSIIAERARKMRSQVEARVLLREVYGRRNDIERLQMRYLELND